MAPETLYRRKARVSACSYFKIESDVFLVSHQKHSRTTLLSVKRNGQISFKSYVYQADAILLSSFRFSLDYCGRYSFSIKIMLIKKHDIE
jgi:hypothetical protein